MVIKEVISSLISCIDQPFWLYIPLTFLSILSIPHELTHLLLKRERQVPVPIPLVKLALKLNPMQPQRVQETLHRIHQQQHRQRKRSPQVVPNPKHYKPSRKAPRSKRPIKGLLKEHSSQLSMSERKSPQTQIRCSVGYSTQYKLNCFNQLVNKYIPKTSPMISLQLGFFRK